MEQAHRAHIALKELQLPYEEVIIDLDKPREEWYLKVNPVRDLLPHLPIDVHELTTFLTARPRPINALLEW